MRAVVPQMGVLIMDDGREFGDYATTAVPLKRPTSVRLAIQGAPERTGLRTVGVVPPEKFTLRTAIAAAAAEGLFLIAAPRRLQDPLSALTDAARAAAKAIDDNHLGFAVLLAGPGWQPRRIAVVADTRDPVTTGLAAWTAVGVATMSHAELTVLVVGDDQQREPTHWREAMQWFKIRSDSEQMVADALERAEEHGVTMRWQSLGTPMDKPAAVLRAVVQGEFDMVIDDLPPLNVGPRPGRRRRVQAALAQAGSNATAYRLLRDAPCDVGIVLDAARMGLASEHIVRAGAAAVAMGIMGAGAIAAAGSAAAEVPVETTAAMPEQEAPPAAAAVAEAKPAPAPDYSTMTEADLAAMTQQRNEAVKTRNDTSAQLKAEQAAQADKTKKLESVQTQYAALEPQLVAAQETFDAADKKATYAAIMSSGPLAVLPGGPTAEEAQVAQAAAEAAEAELAQLEEAAATLNEQSDTLSSELATLETQIAQTQADLAVAEQDAATLTQQTADLKYALNPVVLPTQAGWSISTGFGTGGGYWSSGYHTGLDFAQPYGADVYAAKNGVVVEAGWGGAYGNTVVIQHSDGTQTRYAHLASSNVSVGQEVKAGQQIGEVGSTGNSTGPHLHFEVMDSQGNFMDPAAWLGL